MTKHRKLLPDQGGSAAVEFALAVPVLITFIWGIFQFSLVLLANSGVQNALGEGARYATVYVLANNGPPTEAQIKAKITAAKFGLGNGTWDQPQLTWDATAHTVDISVSYTQPTNFLFFDGPDITLNGQKKVYYSPPV